MINMQHLISYLWLILFIYLTIGSVVVIVFLFFKDWRKAFAADPIHKALIFQIYCIVIWPAVVYMLAEELLDEYKSKSKNKKPNSDRKSL